MSSQPTRPAAVRPMTPVGPTTFELERDLKKLEISNKRLCEWLAEIGEEFETTKDLAKRILAMAQRSVLWDHVLQIALIILLTAIFFAVISIGGKVDRYGESMEANYNDQVALGMSERQMAIDSARYYGN